MILKTNEDGYLIVPADDPDHPMTLDTEKDIVWCMVRTNYCKKIALLLWDPILIHWTGLAKVNFKASVPWSLMAIGHEDKIDAEYLPDIVLRDPSKMRDTDIWKCLKHWRRRQEQNLIPMKFRSV